MSPTSPCHIFSLGCFTPVISAVAAQWILRWHVFPNAAKAVPTLGMPGDCVIQHEHHDEPQHVIAAFYHLSDCGNVTEEQIKTATGSTGLSANQIHHAFAVLDSKMEGYAKVQEEWWSLITSVVALQALMKIPENFGPNASPAICGFFRAEISFAIAGLLNTFVLAPQARSLKEQRKVASISKVPSEIFRIAVPLASYLGLITSEVAVKLLVMSHLATDWNSGRYLQENWKVSKVVSLGVMCPLAYSYLRVFSGNPYGLF